MTRALIILPPDMPPSLADEVKKLILLDKPSEWYLPPVPVYHPDAPAWLARRRKDLLPAPFAECEKWMLLLAAGLNGLDDKTLRLRTAAVLRRPAGFGLVQGNPHGAAENPAEISADPGRSAPGSRGLGQAIA
jgi:hypothetical protein